jgi:hypothetical protein
MLTNQRHNLQAGVPVPPLFGVGYGVTVPPTFLEAEIDILWVLSDNLGYSRTVTQYRVIEFFECVKFNWFFCALTAEQTMF